MNIYIFIFLIYVCMYEVVVAQRYKRVTLNAMVVGSIAALGNEL